MAENGQYFIGLNEYNEPLTKDSIISTQAGRDYFMDALGYRWATIGEVAMAKEAATPGTINQFAASNQIKPRNLPERINEYGFDVGNHGNRAWWVVKANEVNMPVFSHGGVVLTLIFLYPE